MAAVAAKAAFTTTIPSSSSPQSLPNQNHVFRITYPNTPFKLHHRSLKISASISNFPTKKTTPIPPPEQFISRFAPNEPRKGADILVEALERQGVTNVFAYPGGASMEIHQALTRSTAIRNVLPRHEQGGIFAAEGYARSSGLPGVCIATSGPGATNLVSGLADAMLDSVPLIAITGQVPRRMIGTDAFQETPIVEVTRSITKHNYLVLDVDDIPRIVNEAFLLASSGRPGPVLIDIPKDIQQQVSVPNWDQPIRLTGYMNRLPKAPDEVHLESKLDFGGWREELNDQKARFPMSYKTFDEAIPPQYAIQVLDELTNGEAIISTGVGQHQMWAAQFYKYKRPRQWLTSAGLGAMGFGLPAAMGAAVANPDAIVVDIDGDGSFMMNVQELATIKVENLPVKILLLNNQHLGMVVQWEDRFYKANRAHTYLGDPANEKEIFPNMLKFAGACGIPAARVTKRADLRAAIQKMLDTPGPYLLDVIVPHQEHVLPMIPANGSFEDVITEGDGRISY